MSSCYFIDLAFECLLFFIRYPLLSFIIHYHSSGEEDNSSEKFYLSEITLFNECRSILEYSSINHEFSSIEMGV